MAEWNDSRYLSALPSLSDAAWFFETFVLPNYREFVRDQLNVRRAYNAAGSLAHMPDHIAIRGGGSKGNVGNLRKEYASQNAAFAQVEAMCNAFKHFYTRGGSAYTKGSDASNSFVFTTSGVQLAEVDAVVFVSPVNGKDQEFRPLERVLICEFQEGDQKKNIWVGWTLYSALRFVAQQIDREALIRPSDQPNQLALVYRPVRS